MLMLARRVWGKVGSRIQMARTATRADAFLASYPKSGRTWFRYILAQYFARLAEGDGALDLHQMFQVVPNYDLDPVRGIPGFRYGKRRSEVPLILVTHLPYSRSLFLNRPVIFMVRDPRDVIVSAFFHASRHKHRFSGDLNAFIMEERQGLPALVRHLNGWAKGLRHHRSVILSYEELTADTAGTCWRVLEFLGKIPERTAVDEAVAASRFEAMREREIQGGIPAHDYDRNDPESLRMRRGKVGGFDDYLSETQVARITRICDEKLTPAAKALVARTAMELR